MNCFMNYYPFINGCLVGKLFLNKTLQMLIVIPSAQLAQNPILCLHFNTFNNIQQQTFRKNRGRVK